MSPPRKPAPLAVDPEPIRFPLAYGLTALLFLRQPSAPPPAPEPVEDPWAEWQQPPLDPEAARIAVENLTPDQRKALGL